MMKETRTIKLNNHDVREAIKKYAVSDYGYEDDDFVELDIHIKPSPSQNGEKDCEYEATVSIEINFEEAMNE